MGNILEGSATEWDTVTASMAEKRVDAMSHSQPEQKSVK